MTIPVLLELSASGCGPCLWMEKTLIETTKSFNGKIEFVSINVEYYPELIEIYQIKSNPTTLFFIKGKMVGSLKGALPQMAITQWIEDKIEEADCI